MQQTTTRQLYTYWDRIRNGRIAPRRFEVEPAKISSLLSETFIAECSGLLAFRFRLAGTHVCYQFGRELRGVDFLSLWTHEDRDTLLAMLQNITNDGAVVHGTFIAIAENDREAVFEFVLLPLIHTGTAINRILGAFTAVEPPFWLGAEPLIALELRDIGLHWPDGVPDFLQVDSTEAALEARQRFRVVEGGLSNSNPR